jgi:hypothetical protein
MQRLAREFTPRAAEILREIANDPNEDSRNRIVAIGILYDRAWGKPKDYDPATEPERNRQWDPSRYSIEELKQIRAALVLMREDRREKPADRGEEDVEIIPPNLAHGGDKSGVG